MRNPFFNFASTVVVLGASWLFTVCPTHGQETDVSPTPSLKRAPTGRVQGSTQTDTVRPPAGKEKETAPKVLPTEPGDKKPSQTPSRPPTRLDETELGETEISDRNDWFDPSRMLASRSPRIRLASVPNMFGDAAGYALQVKDFSGTGSIDLPPPGGGGGAIKISENDKAMPMDRVFFSYNHFQNALDTYNSGVFTGSLPIDQYTIGAEKTFCDGLWSAEIRLPLVGIPDYADSEFSVDNGRVGNVAVIVKRLLLLTDTTAVAAGLGIDTPTGDNISGQGRVSNYTIYNDSVHLSPFVGFLNTRDRLFCQGFLQVDFATNDNRVVFGEQNLGELHEQTLLYVDLSVGYWLYRNQCARVLKGVAPVIEFHYSSTLQDASIVSGSDGYQVFSYGNIYNRLDISNLTAGLHTELGKTTVRVAGVFPLATGSNRAFDAEVQVSINRRF